MPNTELNFMPNTGNTQGMIFRIKPPNNAIKKIDVIDSSLVEMICLPNVVATSTATPSSTTVIFTSALLKSTSPPQLLAAKVAVTCFSDTERVGLEKNTLSNSVSLLSIKRSGCCQPI